MVKNNFKTHRKNIPLTQEEIAISLHITRQTVIAIENSKHFPSLELALKIARFFNKKVEDIFYLEEEF